MLTEQIRISLGIGTGRGRSALRTKRPALGFLNLPATFRLFFTLALIIVVIASKPSGKARSQEQIPHYKNPRLSVEQRVADLRSRMALEEKIAQMTCLCVTRPQKNAQTDFATDRGDFSPEKAAQVMKYGVGQIARQREQKGPREGAIFANGEQKWLTENMRLGIPAIFHDESLHGHMARGSTSFPQPIPLASTWDPEFIEKVFTAGALEKTSGEVLSTTDHRTRGLHAATSDIESLLDDVTNTPADPLRSFACVEQRRGLIERNLKVLRRVKDNPTN